MQRFWSVLMSRSRHQVFHEDGQQPAHLFEIPAGYAKVSMKR